MHNVVIQVERDVRLKPAHLALKAKEIQRERQNRDVMAQTAKCPCDEPHLGPQIRRPGAILRKLGRTFRVGVIYKGNVESFHGLRWLKDST